MTRMVRFASSKLRLFLLVPLVGIALACGSDKGLDDMSVGGPVPKEVQADQNKTYSLRVNLKLGEVLHFRMSMGMTGDPSNMEAEKRQKAQRFGDVHTLEMGADEISSVKEVTGEEFTISNVYRNAAYKAKGLFSDYPQGGPASTTSKIDTLGRVTVAPNDPGFLAVLPEKPVKIGDTFTGETAHHEVLAKFLAVEEVAGKPALKFEYTGLDKLNGTFDGPVLMWIDPDKGIAVRVEVKTKVDREGLVTVGKIVKQITY